MMVEYMKNKKLFLFIILFSAAFTLFAQVSLDPNDSFYQDAKTWEVKGLTGWLPQIRPYSVSTVKMILSDVKEKGDEKDVQRAEYYEQKFFAKPWNVGFTLGDTAVISNEGDKLRNYTFGLPEVYGDMSFLKYIGFGYNLGIVSDSKNKKTENYLPFAESNPFDTYDDPFTLGPLSNNINMNANITVGKENLYGMFGLNRIAFGPFLNDSVLLSGGQFHTGNFSLIYEGEKWGYTQVFSVLSRSEKNSSSGVTNFKPEKYMGFHSVRFTPNKYFSFSYFESSVYTNRFDPCYLLPVPYMIIQGMYGASDNTISGLVFDVKPVNRIQLSTSLIIDDIDLDGIAKGDFNSRFRFAGIIGATYTPSVKFIDDINFNYTLVTPYTYSHRDPVMDIKPDVVSYYNKDNYTTRLTSLGTKLPPNSDRFYYSMTFAPVKNLKVDCALSFMRHANIAESYTDEEAQKHIDLNNQAASLYPNDNYYFSTDGSVWTSTLTSPTSSQCNFLNQTHKMYVLQCAVNAEYTLPRYKWGTVTFDAGYMFEYIANKGVDSDIYTRYSQSPEAAKKLWVANFKNVINNYFSISVKYCY